jgi:HlyD family secretion protein
MNAKRIVVGSILLMSIVGLMVANFGPKKRVKIKVQTEEAMLTPITQWVTASGKIRPELEVKVAADVGGTIRKLTVIEGDKVQASQLLVEIDPEIYQARLMESRAAQHTARANLSLAEAGLIRAEGETLRVRGLHKKDLVSKADLERANADLSMAEAKVDAARGRLLQSEASMKKAKKDLAKCTLVAPIDGTVTVLNKETGERASGGDFREDIILHVADLSSMEVEVEVGERDVVLISVDDRVDIDVDAYPGVSFSGLVKEIANAGVTRNQWTESEVTNFRVVVQVGQTEPKLRPQMSATVKIRTAHKDKTLTVPIQSVTLRQPGEVGDKSPPSGTQETKEASNRPVEPVEVVFEVVQGKAMARQVVTGLSSDNRIEILQGLSVGARVVSGPYRVLSKDLRHQAAVRVALETHVKRRGQEAD